jgi:hypothetical protein
MADEGGLVSEDRIFVAKVPDFALEVTAADYGPENLADLYREAPAVFNGRTGSPSTPGASRSMSHCLPTESLIWRL